MSFNPPPPLSDVFSPLTPLYQASGHPHRIHTRSASYSSTTSTSTSSTTSSSCSSSGRVRTALRATKFCPPSSMDQQIAMMMPPRIIYDVPRRYEALVQLKVRSTMEMTGHKAKDWLTALPEGSVVHVVEIYGNRAKISRPLTGWVSLVNHKNGRRLLRPIDPMHSKIGGSVKFIKPIQGQMPNKDGKYYLEAAIVDYSEKSGLWKAVYPDNSWQWINLKDPNIVFFEPQREGTPKIKAALDHDVVILDDFTPSFNTVFTLDYPELNMGVLPVSPLKVDYEMKTPHPPHISIDAPTLSVSAQHPSVLYDPARDSNRCDQFVTSICSSQRLFKPTDSSSPPNANCSTYCQQHNGSVQPRYSPLPCCNDKPTPTFDPHEANAQLAFNQFYDHQTPLYDHQQSATTQSATSPPSHTYFPFPPSPIQQQNDSLLQHGNNAHHRRSSGDSTGKIIRIMGLNYHKMAMEKQAKQLFTLCSVFGVVKKVKVDYKERSVAYIEFHTKEQAENVIHSLDGMKFHGKLLKVVLSTHFKLFPAKDSPRTKRDYPHAPLLNKTYRYADRKRKHCDDSPSSQASPSNVLHIANVPTRTTTPDFLRSFLNSESDHDLVMSAVFFGVSADSPTCQAFVECPDIDRAAQVLVGFHGRRFCGRDITISFSTRSHMPSEASLVSTPNGNGANNMNKRKQCILQEVEGEKGVQIRYKGGNRSSHRSRLYRPGRFPVDPSQNPVSDRMRYRRNNADLHKVLNR